jgi:hypothetical protein
MYASADEGMASSVQAATAVGQDRDWHLSAKITPVSHPFFSRFRSRQLGASIVVVSGLPRSGTSMAMSMLQAGGLGVVTDGVRVPDEHNPLGYYEDERVKTLETDRDTSWLEHGRGKAIKIISFLLPHLPPTHHYRVVFLHRDLGEVLASQRKMLNRDEVRDASAEQRVAKAYEDHLRAVANMLRQRAYFDVLDVRYDAVVDRPLEQAHRLARFIGTPLDVQGMAAVVRRELYRNRR